MTDPRMYEQFRAVAVDRKEDPDAASDSFEFGIIHTSLTAAEVELEKMMVESDPPYDEGYIAHRYVTDWSRDTNPKPPREDR